jgi:hypothetical protein
LGTTKLRVFGFLVGTDPTILCGVGFILKHLLQGIVAGRRISQSHGGSLPLSRDIPQPFYFGGLSP